MVAHKLRKAPNVDVALGDDDQIETTGKRKRDLRAGLAQQSRQARRRCGVGTRLDIIGRQLCSKEVLAGSASLLSRPAYASPRCVIRVTSAVMNPR